MQTAITNAKTHSITNNAALNYLECLFFIRNKNLANPNINKKKQPKEKENDVGNEKTSKQQAYSFCILYFVRHKIIFI